MPPAPSVDEFFGPGGLLSRTLPGWEDRPGQLEMAEYVAGAVRGKRNLIVEAGTGTGKTLAYLYPLLQAGTRAVISTSTKNLQEQLIRKDIPFLEKALGRELKVAVMKGRNNFLCLEKLADAEKKPELDGAEELTDFLLIRDWARKTETGDRAELQNLRDDSKLWPKLDARRETCTGRLCEQFDNCFLTRMHQRAREADLIIVNHHLFFADLALRQDDFGSIIPSYQAVVFDEAHEIEAVVGLYFGVSLSSTQIDDWARDTLTVVKRLKDPSKRLAKLANAVRERAKDFFDLFDEEEGKRAFKERSEFRARNARQYSNLLAALSSLVVQLRQFEDGSDDIERLAERGHALRLRLQVLLEDVGPEVADNSFDHPALRLIVEDQSGNFVFWQERRPASVSIQASPIDVGPILESSLFRGGGSVVLASATLAVEESFEYIRGRLGLHSSEELIVPGHFDYRRQVLLYLPPDMPDPRADDFRQRAAEVILELLDLSKGRAFVLFTSYSQMRAVYKDIKPALGFPSLLQGEGPNAELLDAFRRTKNCVLFGTNSFWQGVDLPGEQLSCVIVDKLPFAVPGDPVVQARIEQISNEGGNAFFEYQVPAAVLSLKQGFGRLIRSAKDRGVLALLDNRVAHKNYGKTFLRSLPDYARTDKLGDVEEFFRNGASRRYRT